MNTIDLNIKLSNLRLKCQNIIDNVHQLCKDNPKYVMSEECSQNMDLYFETVKQIEELNKIKVCQHNYICISKDDEVYYECSKCKIIL